MKKRIIGVMGSGKGALPRECDRAFELGQHIARAGWVLLTGGRNEGVMDAANRGAKAAGGLTLGLLPGSSQNEVSDSVDLVVFTGMGHARNVMNVLSSEVVIACGIGLGTASEVALALKIGRPVILVGEDDLSAQFFFRCLESNGENEGGRSPETPSSLLPRLYQVRTVSEAIAQVRQLIDDDAIDGM